MNTTPFVFVQFVNIISLANARKFLQAKRAQFICKQRDRGIPHLENGGVVGEDIRARMNATPFVFVQFVNIISLANARKFLQAKRAQFICKQRARGIPYLDNGGVGGEDIRARMNTTPIVLCSL